MNLLLKKRSLLERLVSGGKHKRGTQKISEFLEKHWNSIVCFFGISAFCYFLKKSGLAASFLNKMKWRRYEEPEIDPPPPGTPLLEDLGPGGIIEHSGLFLGHSRVAELHGDGIFQEVSLTRFLNGDEKDKDNPRCGKRIFAACDRESHRPLVMETSVEFAKAQIGKQTKYNIIANNCHRFTASCILRKLQKTMGRKELFMKGTYSIACLEDVIVEELNGGKPICWLSVRRRMPDFDFTVSSEKLG